MVAFYRLYRPPLRLLTNIATHLHSPRPVPPKPRVVHITPQYFADESYIGGGERFPMELARAMADYTPTRIVSFGTRRRSLRHGRANLEIYPQFRWRKNPGNPLAFGFLRAMRQADVVHCHQFHYRVSAVAILAAVLLRKPVFVTDLGGYATPLSTYLGLSRFVSCFLHLTAFARRWSDIGGTSSLIYGGVDTGRFSPPDAGSKREHFLFVGRLLPHKGIDVLIQAAGEDIPVTIIGRSYDERYYDDLRKLGEGKQVRFITDLDDDRLPELYRSAIAVVLPSVYTDMYGEHHGNPEYLGLTLLEGMACGAPAICSNVGGMPEIVEHQVTGFVVPANDSQELRSRLKQLQGDPALATRMGKAAVETVRSRYTWHKVAERCLSAYHDCPKS